MKLSIMSILALAILIMGCGSARLLPLTQADADRGAAKFPGTTLTSLQEGQKLYQGTCGKCHGLKDPSARTEDKWKTIIPKMAKKAKIDESTQAKITTYLLTMCTVKKP